MKQKRNAQHRKKTGKQIHMPESEKITIKKTHRVEDIKVYIPQQTNILVVLNFLLFEKQVQMRWTVIFFCGSRNEMEHGHIHRTRSRTK